MVSCLQVLVFSNSVRMLGLIKAVMIRQGYIFEYLDGQVPQARRPHNLRSCRC